MIGLCSCPLDVLRIDGHEAAKHEALEPHGMLQRQQPTCWSLPALPPLTVCPAPCRVSPFQCLHVDLRLRDGAGECREGHGEGSAD